MTTLGEVLLALAAISAIVSIVALVWGHRMGERDGEGTTNVGYLATFGVLIFATGAVLVLAVAFFTQNFTFQYVAENHTTDVSSLRWLYQLSGVWAGREGSLLFWEWLLACFAGWVAYKRLQFTDKLSNVALAVTNIVSLMFLVALFIDKNNPFKAVQVLADGSMVHIVNGAQEVIGNVNQAAMNPLLQHWAMIAHPPTLFIGYAGLTIPFAYAIAALILNDGSKRWVELSNRITVFSWLFLGIGIGLGAIWAYVVLGWGGYWAWDPVENASLLPWLTGVALLHSMTLYRRRESFKGWAISLAGMTFTLVVLATFITRSGVVQSVHAFEKDMLSLGLFLGLMILAMGATFFGLFIRRGGQFKPREEFESLTSREAAYYFNNVLMTVAAWLVAYLTVSSALPTWLPFGGQKFAAAAFDNIARPVGILYVLIIVLCPILAWRKTEGPQMWSRIKVPLVAGTVLSVGMVGLWYAVLHPIDTANRAAAATGAIVAPPPVLLHNGEAIVGLIVASYAIVMPLYLFWTGACARAKAKGEGFGTALFNILTKARSQSGGYLAHLGIGIILVGLVGSAMFVQDTKAQVEQKAGATFTAGGYQFKFAKLDNVKLKNNDELTTANFNVVSGGVVTGQVAPAELFNAVSQQSTRNVAIIHEPLRDVFIVLEGLDQTGSMMLTAKVNPLISFTWIGFILMICGTTVAVWPKRQAVAA
jgi:cytochrome c-type biogenesis protein CcmF